MFKTGAPVLEISILELALRSESEPAVDLVIPRTRFPVTEKESFEASTATLCMHPNSFSGTNRIRLDSQKQSRLFPVHSVMTSLAQGRSRHHTVIVHRLSLTAIPVVSNQRHR